LRIENLVIYIKINDKSDIIVTLIFRQFVDDVGVLILVNRFSESLVYLRDIKYFRLTKCYQV